MNNHEKLKLSRRQFAGTLAAALAAPSLLIAQEKKAEAKKEPPTQETEDWEAKALKTVRGFAVPEGLDPAFAFQAEWNRRRR